MPSARRRRGPAGPRSRTPTRSCSSSTRRRTGRSRGGARRAYLTPIGVADVKREGDDLTCVSYGYALHTCLDAAQRLAEDEDISVEVVDVRTLAPLDVETIVASVRKTSKAIVVYEDNTYGAGAEIASTIAEQALFDLDAPIVRVGGPDIPAMPFAAPSSTTSWSRSRTRSRGCSSSLGPDGVAVEPGPWLHSNGCQPAALRIATRGSAPPPADRRRDERPGEDSLARKPPWLKVTLVTGPNYEELKGIMRGRSLHTVCEEAMCPNIRECWEEREATFLILGSKCTRRCGFCDVMTAKPDPVDEDEPARIAEAVREMGLRYVVLTGVARDDLEDGGARIWASAIRAVRDAVPGIRVEVLPRTSRAASATSRRSWTPSRTCSLTTSRPSGLHDRIRPAFGYDRSLEVLRFATRHRPGQVAKSNLILGMGERQRRSTALEDLLDAGIDILTIGQYLQPTSYHLPVDRWVHPDEFAEWKRGRGSRHHARRVGPAGALELSRRQAAEAGGRGRGRGSRLSLRASGAARLGPPGDPGSSDGRTAEVARPRSGSRRTRPRSTTPDDRAPHEAASGHTAADTSAGSGRPGRGGAPRATAGTLRGRRAEGAA